MVIVDNMVSDPKCLESTPCSHLLAPDEWPESTKTSRSKAGSGVSNLRSY